MALSHRSVFARGHTACLTEYDHAVLVGSAARTANWQRLFSRSLCHFASLGVSRSSHSCAEHSRSWRIWCGLRFDGLLVSSRTTQRRRPLERRVRDTDHRKCHSFLCRSWNLDRRSSWWTPWWSSVRLRNWGLASQTACRFLHIACNSCWRWRSTRLFRRRYLAQPVVLS